MKPDMKFSTCALKAPEGCPFSAINGRYGAYDEYVTEFMKLLF